MIKCLVQDIIFYSCTLFLSVQTLSFEETVPKQKPANSTFTGFNDFNIDFSGPDGNRTHI